MLLIGAGNMGGMLLSALVESGIDRAALRVVDPALPCIAGVQAIATVPENIAPQLVLLAVKPQTVEHVLGAVAACLQPDTLVLSIIAGKSIRYLQERLGHHRCIIRAMPNLPVKLGFGATALFAPADIAPESRDMAHALMSASGITCWLDKETQLNAATALSGSGPAYLFYMIECLVRAGVHAGLPESTAQALATQTVYGAAAMAQGGADVASLRQQVTSPGGTTQAGLDVLMGPDGLAQLMRHTLEAAAKRAKELDG